MADLIDRQAAIDTVRSYYDECDDREESIEERIERLPSADIDLSGFSDKLWRAAYERGKAEAVRHGRWLEHKDYPGLAYLCSECNLFTTDRSYYCLHCGARMDEVAQ